MKGDDLWSAFLIMTFVFSVFGGNLWRPIGLNYKFGQHGIDVMIIAGTIRVFRIKAGDIQDAKVMIGLRVRSVYPFSINLSNRWKTRVLVVRKTNGKSFILTPPRPDEALTALEDMIQR